MSNEIRTELEAIAPRLAALERRNLFHVPAGYFDSFSEKMLLEVKTAETAEVVPSILIRAKEAMAKPEVPDGYFVSFAESMLQKVRASEAAEELKSIAPSLAMLPKRNLYTVPAGYFEQLPDAILKQAWKTAKQSVATNWWIQLNESLDVALSAIFKPAYTLAYASCITAVLVGAMFLFKPATQAPCEQLACLSTAEIESYINENIDEFDVEAQEMAIENNTATFANSSGLNENEVEQFLMEESEAADLENAFENIQS